MPQNLALPGLDRKAQVISSSRVSGTHRMLHDEGDLDNDDAWVRGYALRRRDHR
jgi:hypothetical protein